MNRFLVQTPLLMVSLIAYAIAQSCCGVGSSMNNISGLSLEKSSFLLRTSFEAAQSGAQYTGSKKSIDNNKREISRYEAQIEIGYGVNEHLFLTLSNPYIYRNKKHISIFGSEVIPGSADIHGFGDGTLGINYRVMPFSVLTKTEVVVGTKVTIPWGKSKQEFSSDPVPKEFMPGTNTWDITLVSSYFRSFPQSKLGFYTLFSPKFRLLNADKIDYGDQVLLFQGFQFGPFGYFRFTTGVSEKITSKDKRDGIINEGTGGFWVELIPGLEFSPSSKMNFLISGELPLYRNVNGPQLTTAYVFKIASAYLF